MTDIGSGTTYGYLQTSHRNDRDAQQLAIQDHAHAQGIDIDQWRHVRLSSKKSDTEMTRSEFFKQLQAGDTVMVARLVHLGRGLGAITQFVDRLLKARVSLIAVHENMTLDVSGGDLQSRIMTTMFTVLANTEKELISQRTRSGLDTARANGKRLGRPKGSFNSRLDGREEEIRTLMDKGVSKASIARIMDVSSTAFYAFIKSRNLI